MTGHERSQGLPIRVRHTLGTDGSTWTARTVYCPVRRRTMTLAECKSCEKCEGITLAAAGAGGFVICKRPEPAPPDGWTRLAKRILPTAADRTPIGEAMSLEVTCVTPELPLETVIELFVQRGYGSAPVVDDEGFPIGVISKSDLLRGRLGKAGAVVADVMMPIAFTLRESDPLSRAAALMSVEQVHHLPIVSEDGRVVGVLSALDLAAWLARQSGY